MAKQTYEVFICVNEEGDYAVGTDAEDAWNSLTENVECRAVRTIAIDVTLTPPDIETGPAVEIPDAAGETKEVTAKAE